MDESCSGEMTAVSVRNSSSYCLTDERGSQLRWILAHEFFQRGVNTHSTNVPERAICESDRGLGGHGIAKRPGLIGTRVRSEDSRRKKGGFVYRAKEIWEKRE